jgi:hypothetical protein
MNNHCILTPEDALDIYVRAHAGERQADIARDHVISQATVSGIKRGLYWNAVTGHERVRPLTANQDRIRDIYAEYWEKKQPVPVIAARFGVSLTAVYDIRSGATGAKLTGHPNPKLRTRKEGK